MTLIPALALLIAGSSLSSFDVLLDGGVTAAVEMASAAVSWTSDFRLTACAFKPSDRPLASAASAAGLWMFNSAHSDESAGF